MYIGELKKGETLTNMLDYIKFEGEGFGRIEVKGTIAGSTQTVTEVDLQFNARDHKSCVTVGLYDIKPKDGQYKYENRSNQIVARVNTLSFKKTKKTPHMGIKVASISDTEESEGFFSCVKGVIANLFLNPPEVTKLGNTDNARLWPRAAGTKTRVHFSESQKYKRKQAGTGRLYVI